MLTHTCSHTTHTHTHHDAPRVPTGEERDKEEGDEEEEAMGSSNHQEVLLHVEGKASSLLTCVTSSSTSPVPPLEWHVSRSITGAK